MLLWIHNSYFLLASSIQLLLEYFVHVFQTGDVTVCKDVILNSEVSL